MRISLVLLAAVFVLCACGSRPTTPSRVVYTSQDGIAIQGAGGATHFYRFKAGRKD